ncbi:MAG: universal stress protein [Microbacteriaceae bacterium]
MSYVVVGVSATNQSTGALMTAADEARHRNADLVAVQAWRPPRPPASPGGRPPGVMGDTDATYAAAERTLRARVIGVLGPDTEVTCKLVRGAPSSVLLAESARAELLVLDAPRTRSTSRSVLLAHRLIYAAQCPVLIMPPHASNETGTSGPPAEPGPSEDERKM